MCVLRNKALFFQELQGQFPHVGDAHADSRFVGEECRRVRASGRSAHAQPVEQRRVLLAVEPEILGRDII